MQMIEWGNLSPDRFADFHVGLADKIIGGRTPPRSGTVSRSHTMKLAIRRPKCDPFTGEHCDMIGADE